jgi:hypothetical protein
MVKINRQIITSKKGSIMKKMTLSLFLAATTSIAAMAQAPESASKDEAKPSSPVNLFKAGDGEDKALFKKTWVGYLDITTDDKHSGEAAIRMYKVGSCLAQKILIKIDPEKEYIISGWFKSANPEELSRVLMDIRFYTANKKMINARSILPLSSENPLLADAKAGDKELLVAADNWPDRSKLKGGAAIVFDAKEDKSDLPNFSFNRLKKYDLTDKGYKLGLKKPLKKAYPKGTLVRLHKYLDYPRQHRNNLPAKWTKLTFKLSKIPPRRRPERTVWKGAEYMSFCIMNQYKNYPKPLPEGQAPPILLIDDLSIVEVPQKAPAEEKSGE